MKTTAARDINSSHPQQIAMDSAHITELRCGIFFVLRVHGTGCELRHAYLYHPSYYVPATPVADPNYIYICDTKYVVKVS